MVCKHTLTKKGGASVKSNKDSHPKATSWAWPVGLLAAAGVAGLWLWQTHDTYMSLGPAVGLLAPTAALGAVWLYRIRAARRLFAALDAYAEKEVARAERRPHTASVIRNRAFSRSTV
jgi:hypothetical protein